MESGSFFQSCPVCGRNLSILMEHNGVQVTCFHCQATFRARYVPVVKAVSTAVSAGSERAMFGVVQRPLVSR